MIKGFVTVEDSKDLLTNLAPAPVVGLSKVLEMEEEN
jgi:hypothetical protein